MMKLVYRSDPNQLRIESGNDFSNESNPLVVFDRFGRVGIGRDMPNARLHISHPSNGDETGIELTTDNGTINSLIYNDATGNLVLRKKIISDQLVLGLNGKVGLGKQPTTHPLELASGAHCTGSGNWTNASDARLKKGIKKTRYGIKEVMVLNPVDYTMKASGEKNIGFIAQEVQKIIPEVVSGIEGDIDKGETLGISYGNMVAVLTKAMQEQQELIEQQSQQIKELQVRLARIEAEKIN